MVRKRASSIILIHPKKAFRSLRVRASSKFMRNIYLLSGLLLPLLLGALPRGLVGQEDLSVRLIPRFGLTSPDNYFYEEFANFADDEPAEWTTGYLGRAAYVGVALEVGQKDRGLFLRGELAHTFEGWLSAVHGIIRPRVFYDPPEIINTFLDVPASLTFASAQVILPTQFELGGVRPYALVGGGGKWYHFGSPTQANDVEAILPNGGFTAALDLGGGVIFSLFGLDFDAQVRDVINRYWGKTQHDLVFSGGLLWRIR